MVKQNKKRDANFELLRVLSMTMILVLHFNNFGHILENCSGHSVVRYYVFEALEYACIVAVNLYVLISGYFMVKSQLKIKKIVELMLQVLFYSIGIYVILLFTKQVEFNIKDFIKTCIPIMSCQYWFITAYVGLYVLSIF